MQVNSQIQQKREQFDQRTSRQPRINPKILSILNNLKCLAFESSDGSPRIFVCISQVLTDMTVLTVHGQRKQPQARQRQLSLHEKHHLKDQFYKV